MYQLSEGGRACACAPPGTHQPRYHLMGNRAPDSHTARIWPGTSCRASLLHAPARMPAPSCSSTAAPVVQAAHPQVRTCCASIECSRLAGYTPGPCQPACVLRLFVAAASHAPLRRCSSAASCDHGLAVPTAAKLLVPCNLATFSNMMTSSRSRGKPRQRLAAASSTVSYCPAGPGVGRVASRSCCKGPAS